MANKFYPRGKEKMLPDSDMRRTTREDVVHHNVSIFP